jgi:hypothetical protein
MGRAASELLPRAAFDSAPHAAYVFAVRTRATTLPRATWTIFSILAMVALFAGAPYGASVACAKLNDHQHAEAIAFARAFAMSARAGTAPYREWLADEEEAEFEPARSWTTADFVVKCDNILWSYFAYECGIVFADGRAIRADFNPSKKTVQGLVVFDAPEPGSP